MHDWVEGASKPKEEDLKPTGKAFQLLGPATAKDLEANPSQSDWTRNNNVTMSEHDLKAGLYRPGTKDSDRRVAKSASISVDVRTQLLSTMENIRSYTVCMNNAL